MIALTEGELAFVSHFNAETFNQRLGPAISWLRPLTIRSAVSRAASTPSARSGLT